MWCSGLAFEFGVLAYGLLTLGVCVIISYLILYSSLPFFFSSPFLSSSPFSSIFSLSNLLIFLSNLLIYLLFSSSSVLLLSPLPSIYLPIFPSSSSSLPLLISFYTCRYLDPLIYIPQVSDPACFIGVDG